MQIVKSFITTHAIKWSDKEKLDQNSIAGFIIRHIESHDKLRDAQIEAIKVYLWLKTIGDNKPLVDVFSKLYPDKEGDPLTTLLHDLAVEIDNKKLIKYAKEASDEEIRKFFVELFGGYKQVSNVLFSLPMGAGKTFVMASIVYIDLFYSLHNDDFRYAKNFLIFAPSGLKSSVVPSLRTIESFDPTWILPKDISTKIQKNLKFVVLDLSKTAKKSNRIENPNARKVQDCLNQANPSGYVFVTNAEKVILDKVVDDPYKGTLFETKGDEKSQLENELRNKLAKVPNLTILIDEVHHIQKDENKLKSVINNQFNQGNTISIVGFTGTPYHKRKINAGTITITLDQIPSTIYHYDLVDGVKNFLKQPIIKSYSSNTKAIVKNALEDFYDTYYRKSYADGRLPKLAIYCASIDRLENEILPLVTNFYVSKKLDTAEILTYHESSPKDDEIEFGKLDRSYSTKRIVLLCQIGKEGWDCQSLAGVVLSGEGDSPKNMVLQTSCRCLREVDDAKIETGTIYLNHANYKHLEAELQDKHKLTIKEFEQGPKETTELSRVDRRRHLSLPDLKYKQLILEYQIISGEHKPDPIKSLTSLYVELQKKDYPYIVPEIATTKLGLNMDDQSGLTHTVLDLGTDRLTYSQFMTLITKSSLGSITIADILHVNDHIRQIHSYITKNNQLQAGYQMWLIISAIHHCFTPQINVRVVEKLKSKNTSWLVTNINKNPIKDPSKIYPSDPQIIKQVVEDKADASVDEQLRDLRQQVKKYSGDPLFSKAIEQKIETLTKSHLAYENRDHSFHYIPYEFSNSKFEEAILEKIYQLPIFKDKQLDVFFNGDRFISDFKVKIYKKFDGQWKLIQDHYTPDFVIIRRDKKKIVKTLIIETKGAHIAEQFVDIKDFMSNTFLENNGDSFDFLYLEDGKDMSYHYQAITDKINNYFA